MSLDLRACLHGVGDPGLVGLVSVPASVKDRDTVLKGPGRNFSPDEVEVFYLDPSR